jgi:hypothetical protein
MTRASVKKQIYNPDLRLFLWYKWILIAQNALISVMIVSIMKSLEKFSAIKAEKDSRLIVLKEIANQ